MRSGKGVVNVEGKGTGEVGQTYIAIVTVVQCEGQTLENGSQGEDGGCFFLPSY